MKEAVIVFVGVGLMILLVLGLVEVVTPAEYQDHRFSQGDCVLMRLTGEQAMVYSRSRLQASYRVRVFAGETNQTAIFGPSVRDHARPYALIHVKEFELEPCEPSA